jgi:hypothetical protein
VILLPVTCEQTAVLVHDHGEWLLFSADAEPERVWPDFDVAMKDLMLDGWHVAEGPGVIRPSEDGYLQIQVTGYRLKRSV